jgi:hypothetical protein
MHGGGRWESPHHSRSTSRSTRRAAAGLKDQSGQESVLAGRTERGHTAVVVYHVQGAEESELHAAPLKPPAVVNFTEAYQAVTLQAGQVVLDGRWIGAPAPTASPRRRRALRRFLAGDEQGLDWHHGCRR